MSKILVFMLFGPFILALGLITKFFPPKKPNNLYGYRTTRSMKNQDVWEFANDFSSKSFIASGLGMTLVTLICWNQSEENFVLINLVSLLVGLGLSIYMTERQIKKYFDSEGNRKNLNQN
ncbi:MAG: SdpI family protein [Saprospiraceae bacterium]|jgi:uncharacterized membrane protein|nr:SdpI family protein [Saprospiraceae bacterium]